MRRLEYVLDALRNSDFYVPQSTDLINEWNGNSNPFFQLNHINSIAYV
jgi:hypothetical protein